MRISKLMFFFAGALVALVSVWATRAIDANAQAGSSRSGSHVLLAPEDYIEIQQMYSMYSRDVDPGAVRDASWMFADDAVAMISGRKPLTTPEEIQDFYQGVKDRDAGGDRHFNTSYRHRRDAGWDRAWLVVHAGAGTAAGGAGRSRWKRSGSTRTSW